MTVLSFFKKERVKSPRHLKYVRSKGCYIHNKDNEQCNGTPVEAHHLMNMGGRGIALKEVDMWTVPLCRKHHTEVTGYGEEAVFWMYYGHSYDAVIFYAKNLAEASPDPRITKAMELWEINQSVDK